MTKESIQNTILHNCRPIAIHAIWAQFEKYRTEIKNKDRTIKALEEKLNKREKHEGEQAVEFKKEVEKDSFKEFKDFLEMSKKMRETPPDSDIVYGPPPAGFER